ncbi:ROK family protein [Vulgatibacter incomptus]|uniref:Glucokinase n=1 Tax=Vulgatibacter incomptus TaxID=1391653 RepID=A0A0K1PFZ3_9BACT|nr:ROK family protein [Vulgatibacter incomptus]AKU92336.1 Glucokinase [Vulgatibacter incomptus]
MSQAGERLALGCDLGATNLRVAVVDARGTVLSSVRRKLDDRTPSVVAEELAFGAKEALALLGKDLDAVSGLGVGVAGQVAGDSGIVLVGPNLGWTDVRFGALVERAFGRRPRVVNDLSAAAWGERSVGAARGASHVLLVFAGSGVGSGMILGGELYEGAGGIAGELGHVKVVPAGGRPCGCGQRGCLEAYVSGHNLAQRIRELAREGKARAIVRAAGGEPDRIGGPCLEQAAEEGDPEAIELRDEVAQLLGVAIANAVTILNPQKLILGGGVLAGMKGLKLRVREWILRAGGKAQVEQLSILDPALGDDSGVIGAGLLGLHAAR